MRWEQYYDRYNDFVLALEQTELVATVAASALKEFPHNLPADWRKKIAPALANLADALKSVSQEIESAKTSSPRTVAIEGSPGSELIVPIVNYVIATTRASPTDFQKLVLSQQLTMGFAYLSAFMGDSVRVVCCQRPNVLKCAKTFTWQQLIEKGSWERIESAMIEDYVFAFGWSGVDQIVKKFQAELGLTIALPDEVLPRLREAELVRDLFIHNGGRVSAEYLKRSRRSGVVLGERIDLTRPLVAETLNDMLSLAGHLLLDIGDVHFGKDRSGIHCMRTG